MRTALRSIGVVLGVVLAGLIAFFFWASSGRVPDDALAQVTQYDAPDTPPPDTLTATTYNLGYLSGMTNNKPVVRPESLFTNNMTRAAGLLGRSSPDVVGLQEVDFGAARSFDVHQLDTLATRLGSATAAQAVNWDVRYLPFPYGRPAVHFGRVLSGQGVLSQLPIRAHRRYVLPSPPQPFYRSAFYLDRLAQVTLLDWSDRPLVVINVHLEAYDTATRENQARQVRTLYNQVAQPGVPILLLGDFNAELDAPDDSTMALLLDDTALRPAYPDSAAQAAAPTFPADTPTRTIDHILYSTNAFEQTSRAVRCGAPPPPSDHCAVTTSLVLDSISAPSLDSVHARLPPAGPLPAN